MGNVNDNGGNDGSELIINPHARVPDNLHGYSSFNMRLVFNYMNNQLTYYYTFSTIPTAEQACFQQLMK